MQTNENFWWASAHLRIVHPQIERSQLTELLQVEPQELAGPTHVNANSRLWSVDHSIASPVRPDALFRWAEESAAKHENAIANLLDSGADIDIYIGIHSTVVAIGFDLPPMPTIQKLGVKIGVEFFSG